MAPLLPSAKFGNDEQTPPYNIIDVVTRPLAVFSSLSGKPIFNDFNPTKVCTLLSPRKSGLVSHRTESWWPHPQAVDHVPFQPHTYIYQSKKKKGEAESYSIEI